MNKKMDESQNIINYLKFQRIIFNRELPKILADYSYNKNFNNKDKELITPDIKKSINIFKDICESYNINYLNYILILESLPNDKLKNLYRFFSFKWNNFLNKEEELLGEEKDKYKLQNSYSNVYYSSKPKKLILETLETLKNKREISIIYFIGCMNQFIT
jgi:hypothetical protein